MNLWNVLLAVLAAVVVLWVVLGVWRSSGIDLAQKIEQQYREHYLAHAGTRSEPPPLVRWDFERDTLVAIPPEEVQEIQNEVEATGGLKAYGVKVPAQRLSRATAAMVLARIPGVLFHGAFAAATLLLAFLALSIRMR